MSKEIRFEEFREIPGFNGRYILSIEGLVFDKKNNRFCKQEFRKGVKNPKKHMVSLVDSEYNIRNMSVESLLLKVFNVDVVGIIDDLEGEIWKDVKNYEGMYQVSNMGRLKSLPRIIIQDGSERIMYGNLMSSVRNNGNGYINVYLSNGEIGYDVKYIHILVAEHFIDNPDMKPTVNHKDANKKNNRVDNLEWATMKEQMNHVIENNLMKKEKNSFSDDIIALIYTDLVYNKLTKRCISEKYGISKNYLGSLRRKINRSDVTDKVDLLFREK